MKLLTKYQRYEQHRPRATARPCLGCGRPFQPRANDLKRGYGQFCSRQCARNSQPRRKTLPTVPLTIGGTTAIVHLSKGEHALINTHQWEHVCHYMWSCRHHKDGRKYAFRGERHRNGSKTIYLHRQITAAGPDQLVDHWDHNGLNNRDSNLRICTGTQNNANQKARGGSSRFKGVMARRDLPGRWVASIKCAGQTKRLGIFGNETDAARAYDAAAVELFGQFALANFPVSQ